MLLSRQRFITARTFVDRQARPLERQLLAYHLDSGSREGVLAELARFGNLDGGFGQALEPDLRYAGSSALATSVGLQILRDLQAPPEEPLVRGAIGYLVDTYDAASDVWPLIPPAANEAPHAPWWVIDEALPERFGQYLANPRAEILGYLYDYAELVPSELIQELTREVVDHLERLPDAMEMHDLLCYLRLAQTEALPAWVRERIMVKLTRAVQQVVARGPERWEQYGLRPVQVAPRPGSLFAQLLADEIGRNLDWEIAHQQADGSWTPTWSWGDMYPEAWADARREWSGVLTVGMLRALHTWGRIAEGD